ncbi:MAG: hypothetical protein WAL51_05440 [Candidatus Acidiferrales bacterium]
MARRTAGRTAVQAAVRATKQKHAHTQPLPSRHSRKCTVCRHPDRGAIESLFLLWRSPVKLAVAFGIADHSHIYRHAHATGLFARRQITKRPAKPAMDQMILATATPERVIRAVRLYAQLGSAFPALDQTDYDAISIDENIAAAVAAATSAKPSAPVEPLLFIAPRRDSRALAHAARRLTLSNRQAA